MRLFRRGGNKRIDPNERSPRLGLKYMDLVLMKELANTGADLHQPRHVLYYLYAPTSETAMAMAEEARRRGMEAAVDPADDRWVVVCETTVLLTLDLVRENGDFFDALAARHHGKYDGWEAATRP